MLEVNNLCVDFLSGRRMLPVVSGVSFSVRRGEIFALVGESGCGKSASCLALTRLLPTPPAAPRADSVVFESASGRVDLFTLSPRRLRKIRGREIAYIFQEPATSLNPVFRIGVQIAEVLALHRPDVSDRRAETIELLRRVGIPDPAGRVDAFPHELSGGMQQRVMIAMALAGKPSLLIADEPTTALDVTIQAQILELIDRIRHENRMGVILVTHNLGIVAQLADRVAVMYAGRIVERGRTAELLANPRHPYTRSLLEAVPRFGGDGRLATIPGVVPSPDNFPLGCRFFGRCERCEKLPEELQRRCREVVPEEIVVTEGHSLCCHAVAAELSGGGK